MSIRGLLRLSDVHTQVEPATETTALDADRLALGLAPPLEKNVEFLNDCLDDVQVIPAELSA